MIVSAFCQRNFIPYLKSHEKSFEETTGLGTRHLSAAVCMTWVTGLWIRLENIQVKNCGLQNTSVVARREGWWENAHTRVCAGKEHLCISWRPKVERESQPRAVLKGLCLRTQKQSQLWGTPCRIMKTKVCRGNIAVREVPDAEGSLRSPGCDPRKCPLLNTCELT